jgi:predicted nucleotidyltransferase
MKYGLPDAAIHKICAVLRRYPQVERTILYGSRAKGNYKKGSDIDLTLLGSADLTLNVLYKILDDLDELLLPYTIDLSIFDNIGDPDVIDHIQRVGVTFYERGETVSELAAAA